jgi:Ca-activated chloride channel homolog
MKAAFLRRAPFLLVLVCAVTGYGRQANPQGQQPTIRVNVDRVNVGAIVTGNHGQFVEGLRREDFRIFDNDAEQPLTDFAAINEPAQVLLLIEAGPAVYLLEGGHLEAAHALLAGLSPGDRVAVVKYAEEPHALLDFTSNKQAAADSFGQLRFNLGFGSLNLSSSLLKVLQWLTKIQGKKTIVLLSTGLDTSSPRDSATALEQLKISDVRLLAVSLTGGLQTPPQRKKKKAPTAMSAETAQQFALAKQLLEQMAEATGGRAYFPQSGKDFEAAYAEIADLLRHEYSLAFAPPAHDGLVHSISVRLRAEQHSTLNSPSPYRVDHRQAYLAPASPAP